MSVRDKINNGEYRNTLPYPKIPTKPVLMNKNDPAEIRAYADAVERYNIEREAHQVKVATYHGETAELEEKLRYDIEDENAMHNHPKADLLWGKAWERGHSGGYAEVLSVYEDLVDLVK